MGSSSSKVTDYERRLPDVSGLDPVEKWDQEKRDPGFMSGVALGIPLGAGVACIVLAVTGVLVSVCGS